MVLKLDSMLMPQPRLNPINFDMGGGESSMERQRLQLMREQFEETKRQHQQDAEYNRLAEQGRMAREQMQTDRAAAAQKAQAAEQVKKERLGAMAKFSELNGQGDVEGARAMVPLMSAMGMSVDLEGEENGLPRYRVSLSQEDRAARDAAQAGIGYPGDDSGTMEPPASLSVEPWREITTEAERQALTSEDPANPRVASATEPFFRRAQLAARGPDETGAPPDMSFAVPGRSTPMAPPIGLAPSIFENTGRPARGPDQPDFTGAVPRDVIDTGAVHAQTLARLNPALSGLVDAYPREYRGSAVKTAEAVKALGLPAAKSVEMFDKMRGSPDSLIRADIQGEATRGEQSVRRAEAGGKEAQDRYETGFKVLGKETADKYAVDGIIERQKTRSQAAFALDNSDDADDYMAGASIARDMGEKGVLTEGDIKRTLGTASMSFLDRLKSGTYKEAVGGLAPDQKKALRGLIDKADKEDRKRAMSMLDNMDEVLNDPDTDKDVARGVKDYRRLIVPKALRDEHDSVKKRKRGAAPAEQPQGFNMEADANAEFGRTVEGQTTIPHTSRIAFEHNNPGNLKFVDQDGATQGEAAEDGGSWAKFARATRGVKSVYKVSDL